MQQACSCCAECKTFPTHWCAPTLTEEQLYENFEENIMNNLQIHIMYCECNGNNNRISKRFKWRYQRLRKNTCGLQYFENYDGVIILNHMYSNSHGNFQIYETDNGEMKIISKTYHYEEEKKWLRRINTIISKSEFKNLIITSCYDSVICCAWRNFIEEIEDLLLELGLYLVETFKHYTFILKRGTVTKKAIK
jgi:hypothetical protein